MRVVYLVGNKQEGRYKIGVTTDINQRLRGLSTASPIKIELITLWFYEGHRKLEKYLHTQFHANHLNGEWFQLSEEDISRCNKLAVRYMAANPVEEQKEKPRQKRIDKAVGEVVIAKLKARRTDLLEEIEQVKAQITDLT
jgi:hypothetical protein